MHMQIASACGDALSSSAADAVVSELSFFSPALCPLNCRASGVVRFIVDTSLSEALRTNTRASQCGSIFEGYTSTESPSVLPCAVNAEFWQEKGHDG